MNGRKMIELGSVAAVATLLSSGLTFIASRETKAAEQEALKARVTAVEVLSIATSTALKTHLEQTERGYQSLYALEADVAAMRQRQEWAINVIGAMARKQGIPFVPPPPETPMNRGPNR